jgi:hypothetical protein
MWQRCTNPEAPNFHDYGGRGITICERWRHYENFLADMGERPPRLSIGRRDNDAGYAPDNCRWETTKQQARNKRTTKLTDATAKRIREVVASGQSGRSLAAELGVHPSTVHAVVNGKIWAPE